MDIATGASVEVALTARVLPGRATQDGEVVSNIGTVTIRIRPEHILHCSDVIGKVFYDRNGNAIQDGPDSLAGRDIFRDTGGSIYFLNQQDISRGSDHLTIEITDPTNGRVLDRRTLAYGTDYTINYTQGVIRLNQPLSAYAGTSGLISENPNGDNNVNLVVAYEYTPTASDLDGFAYGARAEAWVSDSVRICAGSIQKPPGRNWK